MTREHLEYAIWAGMASLAIVTWFITLTNNHYKRGYKDGFERAKELYRAGIAR